MITPLETLYTTFLHSTGVQTDTRKLQPGELFWALRGERFDGNRFAAQALEAGALAAVVDADADFPPDDNRFLAVNNSLTALQELARHHRRQWSGPLLGLTGSNGKTTTKGLLASILNQKSPGLATPGNWNNHIGVPLTLLRLKPEHEWAVIELGDNHPGEIDELCRIAEPTHGLITNIGEDHLEGYGSLAVNAHTKLELFQYLQEKEAAKLYVNLDDSWLAPSAAQSQALGYALKNITQATYRAEPVPQPTGLLGVKIQKEQEPPIQTLTQLSGVFNLENCLAAAAVALDWGATAEQVQAGLEAYQPENLRSQTLERKGRLVLLDSYNANPSSMRLAVASAFALAQTTGRGRVGLVLGDMLEMGVHSVAVHRQLGEFVGRFPAAYVLGVGPAMRHTVQAARLRVPAGHADSTQAVTQNQLESLRRCKLLLFKGSRGIAVETLLERL